VGVEVINGDCLEVMRRLKAERVSFDAAVTDPPYGMGKNYGNDSDKESRAMWLVNAAMPLLFSLLREGGMAFVFGSPRLIHRTVNAGESAGFMFHRYLWMYKPNDCTFPWRGWLMTSEVIAVFSKGKPDAWDGDAYCHDTYIFNHDGGELPKGVEFPSVKPLSVVRDLVSKCPGSSVIDPFMGSGTTGVACVLEGKEFVGVELNAESAALAEARIMRAQGMAVDYPRRSRPEKILPLFATA
jgi:site-specific DNA-methyltransferase (adenine-specific)